MAEERVLEERKRDTHFGVFVNGQFEVCGGRFSSVDGLMFDTSQRRSRLTVILDDGKCDPRYIDLTNPAGLDTGDELLLDELRVFGENEPDPFAGSERVSSFRLELPAKGITASQSLRAELKGRAQDEPEIIDVEIDVPEQKEKLRRGRIVEREQHLLPDSERRVSIDKALSVPTELSASPFLSYPTQIDGLTLADAPFHLVIRQ
jgi:hypothetical protein